MNRSQMLPTTAMPFERERNIRPHSDVFIYLQNVHEAPKCGQCTSNTCSSFCNTRSHSCQLHFSSAIVVYIIIQAAQFGKHALTPLSLSMARSDLDYVSLSASNAPLKGLSCREVALAIICCWPRTQPGQGVQVYIVQCVLLLFHVSITNDVTGSLSLVWQLLLELPLMLSRSMPSIQQPLLQLYNTCILWRHVSMHCRNGSIWAE